MIVVNDQGPESNILDDIDSLIIQSNLDNIQEFNFFGTLKKLFKKKKPPKRLTETKPSGTVKARSAAIYFAIMRLKQEYGRAYDSKNEVQVKNEKEIRNLIDNKIFK